MISIDLSGKTALIAGVQNEHSLGWPVAQRLMEAGARCAFSFQGERNRATLEKLTAPYENAAFIDVCDVTQDEDLDRLFARLSEEFGHLDYVLHAIAFAPPAAMQNPFLETGREDWKTALDVSAYSLVAVAQRAAPLMGEGGSIVCLTYYASQKVVARYNVMGVAKAALEASTRYLAFDLGQKGVRVNAVSPGPMRTVAARSIPGFNLMIEKAAKMAPLGRNATHEEVANACLWFFSDLSTATSGEVLYVDGGYHVMGMPQG
ncbi:MAG TPA: enoyl-ACP reductase [Deinococcales bacterium]|nr:enoyl-ACP reductase [Deinococcales bacterium]